MHIMPIFKSFKVLLQCTKAPHSAYVQKATLCSATAAGRSGAAAAAAALVITAAAAAANENDRNNDPAAVTAKESLIIHSETS